MLQHLRLATARFLALACVLAGGVTGLEAQEVRQQRVLVLYVTTPGSAGFLTYETTFQKIFNDALGQRLDYHSEFVDLARFSDATYPATLADFLRYKYQHLPPDVVIAPTGLGRQFAEQFRSQIFPGVPIVFIDRLATSHREPNTTGVHAAVDMAATIELAKTLQPETDHVFVVSGVSTYDLSYRRMADEQLLPLARRIPVTYLNTRTFAELERTVMTLPPRSVIFFVTFTEDGSRAKFVSLDAAERIAQIANAPTYHWNGIAIDRHLVGGRLYSNEIVAARSAEMVLRILRGENADDLPIVSVDPHVTQLDWRQLRRWQIDEALVPAGAAILFRDPTLWDRYKLYISGALALVLLQSALIAGLLVQRTRRQRAETEMRQHQHMLEQGNRQISELFGRLIAAQETERSRIARELHDDVSQRIAALSLSMSSLKRKITAADGDPDSVVALGAMQRDANALAEEVRHVSHDLHPSALQHAGLVPALHQFCGQFGTAHALTIAFSAAPDLGAIDGDAALCLYRVTQEALHNVAKHAGANDVRVALTRADDVLHLVIVDDGKGFSHSGGRAAGAGLGLISIDERVRLLGGHVAIESRPGGGTRVQVGLPRQMTGAIPVAGTRS